MKISIESELPCDQVSTDLLAIGVFFENAPITQGHIGMLDWRLNGFLSKIILKTQFKRQWMEQALIPCPYRLRAKSVLLLGLGERQEFSTSRQAQYLIEVLKASKKLKLSHVCLSIENLGMSEAEIRSCLEKAKAQFSHLQEFTLLPSMKDAVQ